MTRFCVDQRVLEFPGKVFRCLGVEQKTAIGRTTRGLPRSSCSPSPARTTVLLHSIMIMLESLKAMVGGRTDLRLGFGMDTV